MRDDSVNTNTNTKSSCRFIEAGTALILDDFYAVTAFNGYTDRISHPHPLPTLLKLFTETPPEQL